MTDHHSLRRILWVLLLGLVAARCNSVTTTGPDGPTVQEATHRTTSGTEHTMVLVPGGPFVMGSEFGSEDERPVREVYEDAFLIDKYEVTNALFAEYAAATGASAGIFVVSPRFSDPTQPVVGVTWSEAQAYCSWAGLRLPSEAEWEKAARGEDGRAFPWGEAAPTPQHAEFGESGDSPATVGSHPDGASPYGAHDMAGNVWEWTRDNYQSDFYEYGPTRNPICTYGGEESDHSLRGGSWASGLGDLRAPGRALVLTIEADQVPALIGFRCAKDAE